MGRGSVIISYVLTTAYFCYFGLPSKGTVEISRGRQFGLEARTGVYTGRYKDERKERHVNVRGSNLV